MNVQRILAPLLLPALLVGVWWKLSENSSSPYFPPLEGILRATLETWTSPAFGDHLVPSLTRFGTGFLIALVLALGMGVLAGLVPRIRRDLWPIAEYFRALPMAAILPPVTIALGPKPTTEIALVAFASTWYIYVATVDGVRAVDPTTLDVARSYGMKRWRRVFHVVLPAAAPTIAGGVRIALAIGFAVMLISNMWASTSGVGYFILNAQASFNVHLMWAGILGVGVVGILLHGLFSLIEYVLLGWHRGWRSAASTTKSR